MPLPLLPEYCFSRLNPYVFVMLTPYLALTCNDKEKLRGYRLVVTNNTVSLKVGTPDMGSSIKLDHPGHDKIGIDM